MPFDQRVFDVLAIEASSEPVVEDAVDELVIKAAVTVHRNSE